MRKTITTVVALAALALPTTAQAVLPSQHPAGSDGHEFTFTGSAASVVKIDYKPRKDKFVGTLNSDFVDTEKVLETEADEAAVCVEGRKVSVYKFRRHRSDRLIGTDTVGALGNWSVRKGRVNGRYYATVGKSSTLLREYYGGIDYYVSCLGDSSGRIRL